MIYYFIYIFYIPGIIVHIFLGNLLFSLNSVSWKSFKVSTLIATGYLIANNIKLTLAYLKRKRYLENIGEFTELMQRLELSLRKCIETKEK